MLVELTFYLLTVGRNEVDRVKDIPASVVGFTKDDASLWDSSWASFSRRGSCDDVVRAADC